MWQYEGYGVPVSVGNLVLSVLVKREIERERERDRKCRVTVRTLHKLRILQRGRTAWL